ncbi:MAG TPA: hypothetical protein VHZ76_04830, partial [Gammaproteobacteria bacterium]|nr:hypothetical protein [Gammaproteobacteria bacterium]
MLTKYWITTAILLSLISLAIWLGWPQTKPPTKTETPITNNPLTIQQIQTPLDQLIKTLVLLNDLEKKSLATANLQLDLSSPSYAQALITMLLPSIQHYLEDYLQLPVNKNTDMVYAT